MISVRAIVALYFTLVSSAFAADITAKSWEATGSNFSRLTISIIGPIEKGDAKKVAELVKNDGNQAFDDWHDRVAVLDSPGGSFEEAIALMKLFRKEAISTYVPENARCLSACALVFMAGTDTSVYFLTNNRVLHPKGQLGFHAPSLDFPNDIEVPGSSRLLNQTYASALRSIAQVVDQMEELVFEEGGAKLEKREPVEDNWNLTNDGMKTPNIQQTPNYYPSGSQWGGMSPN